MSNAKELSAPNVKNILPRYAGSGSESSACKSATRGFQSDESESARSVIATCEPRLRSKEAKK